MKTNLPDCLLHRVFDLEVSAASGLVLRDGLAWVVADDRLALDAYDLVHGSHHSTILLEPGATTAALPKPEKPDLEALADLGEGRLLALGSGSKPNRGFGYLLDHGRATRIDLSDLYERLRGDIKKLNIEAAVRRGAELLLAHRGSGRKRASCIVRIDLDRALRAPDGNWPACALIDITEVQLGKLDGTPLGITDLALDSTGRLHYLAAAEITDDPYLDGRCRGSVIGVLDERLRPQHLARLRPEVKAEGLAWRKSEEARELWWVVTDADDPSSRATLFELRLPQA